jgi:hypothetical protein
MRGSFKNEMMQRKTYDKDTILGEEQKPAFIAISSCGSQ